jgi:zinc transporter
LETDNRSRTLEEFNSIRFGHAKKPAKKCDMIMPSPSQGGQAAEVKPASSSTELPDKGLLRFAYILGTPTPQRLNLDEILRWEPNQGALWVHLDRIKTLPEWLKDHQAIDPALLQSLLAESRRLRVEVLDHEHLLIVFRTVNVPVASAADVKQDTRACLSPMRALTMSDSHLGIFEDCAQQIESGRGPKTIPEFLVRLMDNLVKRAELGVLQIDADMTDVELDQEKGTVIEADRPRAIRRRAMQLRRSMTPYREVLVQLNHLRLQWLRDKIQDAWNPMVEDAAEVVEEVNGVLDRARLVQESISDRLAKELNQRVYVLTLISGMMLPLTFLTGLLGVNLGGIPGANSPWAFTFFCVLLGIVGVCQVLVFRRLRWWK